MSRSGIGIVCLAALVAGASCGSDAGLKCKSGDFYLDGKQFRSCDQCASADCGFESSAHQTCTYPNGVQVCTIASGTVTAHCGGQQAKISISNDVPSCSGAVMSAGSGGVGSLGTGGAGGEDAGPGGPTGPTGIGGRTVIIGTTGSGGAPAGTGGKGVVIGGVAGAGGGAGKGGGTGGLVNPGSGGVAGRVGFGGAPGPFGTGGAGGRFGVGGAPGPFGTGGAAGRFGAGGAPGPFGTGGAAGRFGPGGVAGRGGAGGSPAAGAGGVGGASCGDDPCLARLNAGCPAAGSCTFQLVPGSGAGDGATRACYADGTKSLTTFGANPSTTKVWKPDGNLCYAFATTTTTIGDVYVKTSIVTDGAGVTVATGIETGISTPAGSERNVTNRTVTCDGQTYDVTNLHSCNKEGCTSGLCE